MHLTLPTVRDISVYSPLSSVRVR